MTIDTSAVLIEKDIVLGRGGDRELLGDVYRPPAGTEKRTAVIHFHGGGYRDGSKENVARTALPFAALGYVCIAAQYRLGSEAKWPAQLEDAKASIRWARAHADSLAVDATKIAVAGYSAGAHLALIAAGTAHLPQFEGQGGNAGVSSEVAACLAFYAPGTTRRGPDGSDHVIMAAGSDDEAYRRASPMTYISDDYPPTALFHATGDTTIPFDASMRLFQKLRDMRVPVELHLFEGLSHVFDRHPEFAAPGADLCDLFLDRHVVEQRVYPPFEQPAAARR